MVTRELDKFIQNSDFFQNERLRPYLSDSEKNGFTVKIHCACQKTFTNEIKRKGETVSTTSKKIRSVRRCDRVQLEKSLFLLRILLCVSEGKNIGNIWTLPFKQNVQKTCDQRNNKWAQ